MNSRAILIIFDGMRPDYVRPDWMPNLCALAEAGVRCTRHHAVFPTDTRVNSASIATGAWPGRHGLLSNSLYFAEAAPDRKLDTGKREELQRADAVSGGRLLTTTSLGEALAAAGKRLFVASSGTAGQSFLLNHKVPCGAIVNTYYTLPESLHKRVVERIGGEPPPGHPNLERNRRAFDAFLNFGLDEIDPHATLFWISDPDHTAHKYGIGSPTMIEAVKGVDGELGRLIEGLRARGEWDRTNLMIASDHGFITFMREGNIHDLVAEYRQDEGRDRPAPLVTEMGIYLIGHDATQREAATTDLVRRLQAAPWVGAVFTRAASPGDPVGRIPGTFSFDLIHWDHPRSADVFFDYRWRREPNDFGFQGLNTYPGGAGHGSSSPWEMNPILFGHGPAFKTRLHSDVPTGAVDLAPTILHLLGESPAASMQGRILHELLADGPSPESVEVAARTFETNTAIPGGLYRQRLYQSQVAGVDYIDYTEASHET